VQLASSQGRGLAFVFVADVTAIQPEGLFGSSGPSAVAVRQEMIWTGTVLLRIAKLQAARAGVDAELFIRHGSVREEVASVARQIGATLVLLGAPRGSTGDISDDSAVSSLARAIRDEADVRVEVTIPEEPSSGASPP
jgi:nucleotide-binding universal stress UspA family protein